MYYAIYYWHQNYFTLITCRTWHFETNISTDTYKYILLFNGNTHVWREWFQNIPNDQYEKWPVSLDLISIVILGFPLPLSWFSLPVSTLHTSSPASKYETMNQWWGNAGPALQTLDHVSWASSVVCKQWICILVYRGAPTPEVPKARRKLKSIDN